MRADRARRAARLLLGCLVVGGGGSPPLHGADITIDVGWGSFILADFNQGGWRTNHGDPFGTWDHDPEDRTQFCHARLVEEPRIGAAGYSLMMDYDVQSPNPAFNGFWMKLPSVPLRNFRTLTLAIKGDATREFTKRLKLELKDGRQVADFILDGIQTEWVQMRVPLRAFRNIEHLRTVTEFVIVFDDATVTKPVGTLYLDEVAFEAAP